MNTGSEESTSSRLLNNVVQGCFKGEGLNEESEDSELDACSWELKAAKLNNTGQHEPLIATWLAGPVCRALDGLFSL